MAQQTAVEWLLEIFWGNEGMLTTKQLEEAKEMEKQQRIRDYNIGYQDAQCNHINDAENYIYESSSRI